MKKVLTLLMVTILVLVGCGKSTDITITDLRHFFPEVGHRVELTRVKIDSDKRGVIGFDWTNRNDESWSFNGSGITVFATQNDKEVSSIDVTSPSFATKVNPEEKFYVSFDVNNINFDEELEIHFKPLEGEEYIVIVDLNTKEYKEK